LNEWSSLFYTNLYPEKSCFNIFNKPEFGHAILVSRLLCPAAHTISDYSSFYSTITITATTGEKWWGHCPDEAHFSASTSSRQDLLCSCPITRLTWFCLVWAWPRFGQWPKGRSWFKNVQCFLQGLWHLSVIMKASGSTLSNLM
jgi:hypothetical protein